MSGETIEALIFVDTKGNKMFFSSLAIWSKDKESRSKIDINQEGFMIKLSTELTIEGWKVFDAENLPHAKGELQSRVFLHGYATAYVFEGPNFDEVLKEVS